VRPTWAALRADVARRLEAAGFEHGAQEARWMLEEAAGERGADLVAIEGDASTVNGARHLAAMVDRRIAGEPLQYVLGSWSFRGIDVYVDPRVLIPRPETELTAELAIEEAVRLGARRGKRSPFSGTLAEFAVVDLGTGSGAMALALASELPEAEVWATDASPDALAVARANLAGAGNLAARVRVAEGDWFGALPSSLRGGVRIVVSNPPYVTEGEVADLPAGVRDHEPRDALVSGPTGLESIERIVRDAPEWLEARGTLVVELDPRRAIAAGNLARDVGFADVRVEPDLTGRPRVLVARMQIWQRESGDAVASSAWRTSSTSTR
jgi:release factor glutamine methyltransferase